MRIGIVCRDFPLNAAPTGGVGRYSELMARGLAGLGHEVTVLMSAVRAREAGRIPGANGTGARVLGVPGGMPFEGWPAVWRVGRLAEQFAPMDDLHYARSLTVTLKDGNPRTHLDIVEAPDLRGYGGGVPRGGRGPRLVIRLHGTPFHQAMARGEKLTLKLRLANRMERHALRRADSITAPSRAILASLADGSLPRDVPVEVIPNPIDVETYRPGTPERGSGYLLFVGRIEYGKGVHHLAEAVRILRHMGSVLHFILVGHDGPAAYAQEVRKRLAHDPRVELRGPVAWPELIPLYQGALAMVLPSRTENCPYAVLEALACGTPVIASRVGGIPEIVDDGGEGILVPPDNPKALADAILALASNRERCLAMGRAGRRKAEACFSLDRIAQRTVRLYESVIRPRERAA